MAEVARTSWLVGDAELSVLVAGDGPRPVVLLHGIPSGAELWRGVAAGLADAGFHALAPDLPGYGRTRLPAGHDHSLTGSVELLARWLADSGLGPVWLVGHDVGGAVAQLLAVRHRQAVGWLTLTNSVVDGSWPAPRARISVLAARLRLVSTAARLGLVPNPYVRWAVRRSFAVPGSASPADLDRAVWDTKFSDHEGRRSFERSLVALSALATAEAAAGLPELDVPCQLVWGMQDPYQRWSVAGRRLRELLPGPTVAQLDGCGHFTPLECGDRLLAAMLDWFRDVS